MANSNEVAIIVKYEEDGSVRLVTGNVEEFGRKAESAGKQATLSWSTLKKHWLEITAISAALVGATDAVLGKYARFEQSLANVSTLVDTNVVSMDRLKNQILALPPALGSAKELTDALYQALSSGIDAAQGVEFVGIAAKAAKAGLSDAFTAVDAGTTILNAFGLETSEATKIFDQMFMTVNLGKTTFPELAEKIGLLAPMMSAAKIGTEEMFAAVSTLTIQGIDTARAVTYVRQAISNIIKPSKEAAEMADSLGLAFNAQALASKGLQGFLQDVYEKTGGNVEQMQLLFGSVEAFTAALGLIGPNAETFIQHLEKMRNAAGTVDEAYEKQIKILKELWNTTLNYADRALIKLGGTIAEGIYKVIDFSKKYATLLTTVGEIAAITAAIIAFQKLSLILGSGALVANIVAMGSAIAAIAPAIAAAAVAYGTYKLGTWFVDWGSGLNDLKEETAALNKETAAMKKKLAEKVSSMGLPQKDIDDFNRSVKEGTVIFDAAKQTWVKVQKDVTKATQDEIDARNRLKEDEIEKEKKLAEKRAEIWIQNERDITRAQLDETTLKYNELWWKYQDDIEAMRKSIEDAGGKKEMWEQFEQWKVAREELFNKEAAKLYEDDTKKLLDEQKKKQDQLERDAEKQKREQERLAKEQAKAYEDATEKISGFFDDIFGDGQDLDTSMSEIWDRIKGYAIKSLAEIAAYSLLAMSQSASAIGNMLNSVFRGFGVSLPSGAAGAAGITTGASGGTGGLSGIPGLSGLGSIPLPGGWEVGLGELGIAAVAGNYLPQLFGGQGGLPSAVGSTLGYMGGTMLSGVEILGTAFGTSFGASVTAAASSVLGATLGSMVVPVIGSVIGMALGEVVGGLFEDNDEQKRAERGVEFGSDLYNYATAESIAEIVALTMSNSFMAVGPQYANYPHEFAAMQLPGTVGVAGDYVKALSGMHHYSLDFEGQGIDQNEFNASIGQAGFLAASFTNSLDEMNRATAETGEVLGAFKDSADLARQYAEELEGAERDAMLAYAAMYDNMRTLAVDDIMRQVLDETMNLAEATEFLINSGLTPAEAATTKYEWALIELIDNVVIGSEEMDKLYSILKQSSAEAAKYAGYEQELANAIALLGSDADLTSEQVGQLINYTRDLELALQGDADAMERVAKEGEYVAWIMMNPMEQAMKTLDDSLQAILTTEDVFSEQFWNDVEMFLACRDAVSLNNFALEEQEKIISILTTAQSLTGEQLITLVWYYQDLTLAMEGNLEAAYRVKYYWGDEIKTLFAEELPTAMDTFIASLKEAEYQATTSSEAISKAFTEGFKAATVEEGWDAFTQSIHQSIYDTIVQSVIDAFIMSEIYQAALTPFTETLGTAMEEAWATGVFDPVTFNNIIGPAIDTTLGNIEDMEPAFNAVSGVLDTIEDQLGLNIEPVVEEINAELESIESIEFTDKELKINVTSTLDGKPISTDQLVNEVVNQLLSKSQNGEIVIYQSGVGQ